MDLWQRGDDAVFEVGGDELEVADVPGVDALGIDLACAAHQERIIDDAAGRLACPRPWRVAQVPLGRLASFGVPQVSILGDYPPTASGSVRVSFTTPIWASETKTTEWIFRREGQTDAVAPDCQLDTCTASRSEGIELPSDQRLRERSQTPA